MDSQTTLLIAMFILAGTFNVIFPIVLGWWIIRRNHTSWRVLGVGVVTFIGSQVLHMPVVAGLNVFFNSEMAPVINPGFAPFFNGIVLGLLAGLFEETARWIGYRALKQKGNSFGAALTLGAGHGGIEALTIGVVVLFTLVSMLALRALDASSLGLPQDQLSIAVEQMQAYFATPWYLPLAGAIERIGAVALHISLSIMVWLSFARRKALWFWGAVFYHALVDGLVVIAISLGMNTWLLEALLILIGFGGLYWMIRIGKKVDTQQQYLIDEVPQL